MVAVYARGTQLLDIDFTGGSSVTFTLKAIRQDVDCRGPRRARRNPSWPTRTCLIVERGTTNTRYQIDTSEQSVDTVKEIITKTFGDKLMTYSLEIQRCEAVHRRRVHRHRGDVARQFGRRLCDGRWHEPRRAARMASQRARPQPGTPASSRRSRNPELSPGSGIRFKDWTVRFVGLDEAAAQTVCSNRLQREMNSTPLFPLANKIGGRVSGDMQIQALYAIVVSLVRRDRLSRGCGSRR